MPENKNQLTPEQIKARKDTARFRIFVLLVIFDILLVGYLVFEMIMIFSTKK